MLALVTATTSCSSNTNNITEDSTTSTDSSSIEENVSSDIDKVENEKEKTTKKQTDPPTDPPYDITPLVNDIKNGNYYSASTEINSMSYDDYDEEITSAFKAEVSDENRLIEIFGDTSSANASTSSVSEDIKNKWNDLSSLYNSVSSKSSEDLVDYGNYISDILEYCSLESDFETCTETLEYGCLTQNMLNTTVYSSREEIHAALLASEYYHLSLYETYSSTNDQLLIDFFNAVDLWGVTLTNYYNAVYVNNSPVDTETANADMVSALTQYKTVLQNHQTNLTNKINLVDSIFNTQKTLS